MPGIFISYRRSDTPDAVGRIYDRLVSEFGKAKVFKDVDSIPLGQDFRGHLNDIVGGCAVVLAIIGPKWVDIRDEEGKRRLDEPDDFVRIELEAALARSVPVVPVLVGHAPMPGTSQLPSTLASLAFRQSIEVRPDPDFHNDATRLVSALWAIVDPDALRAKPVQNANPRNGTWRWLWPAAFAAAAVAAIAFSIPALRHLRETPPPETRLDIITPDTEQPRDFALSPDGRQIVYQAADAGGPRLWLRTLATTTVKPLSGTEGARTPFWSPDGRSIGFFAAGRLKKIDLESGALQNLAVTTYSGLGGTWSANGEIIFASGAANSSSPMMRMPDGGGEATPATTPATGEFYQAWPQWLPDGRSFLYFVQGIPEVTGIYLGRIGKESVKVVESAGAGAFMAPDWLLRVREGVLVAQRLDLVKGSLVGEPVTVASAVSIEDIGRGIPVSVNPQGWIAYRANSGNIQTQLSWMDRSGRVLGNVGIPERYLSNPRVSPDGKRIAVDRVVEGNSDIWLLDGSRMTRLTFSADAEARAVWSPDGARVIFRSHLPSGEYQIHQRSADGDGERQILAGTGLRTAVPTSLSSDGRFLLYFEGGVASASADLFVLPMEGERKATVILDTSSSVTWGNLSPDGRWVAYQSLEAGVPQVFVRKFLPEGATVSGSSASASQWQASVSGGSHPVWSRDGRELFYLDSQGALTAVAIISTGATPVIGNPERLFPARALGGGGFGVDASLGRQYDVAPDGRFLINTVVSTDSVPPITLIQNWNPDAGE